VEEKAMQRGASAHTTWSVEKDGVQGREFPHREGGNGVVIFRTRNEKGAAAPPKGRDFRWRVEIIGVRGKACAPQLMLLSIGFPDEKQLMGLI
jgi:hypothetical protein